MIIKDYAQWFGVHCGQKEGQALNPQGCHMSAKHWVNNCLLSTGYADCLGKQRCVRNQLSAGPETPKTKPETPKPRMEALQKKLIVYSIESSRQVK